MLFLGFKIKIVFVLLLFSLYIEMIFKYETAVFLMRLCYNDR